VRAIIAGFALVLAACAPSAPASSPSGDETPAEPSIVVTPAMGSPHIGDPAPDFELADRDGNTVKLSSTRGQVTVLAFVAAFCPFSKAEQPYLKKLAEDYAPKGVRVILIGISEPAADFASYLARMPMPMPAVHDADGAVALKFTPPGAQPQFKDRSKAIVTSNLVIDRKGTIRFFTLADTVHFDAKLVHVRRAVDQMLAEGS
jgi:peroxiredoxin